ncbi:hypothetical protein CASFOL_032195 [Castilleja foliolosa]|uniref:C2H2-type domain-containing protein n=1 Tax=Castilleja foliolosa TaxID=1961234 RepID=A0ABD3C244_9LAMI
MKFWGVEVKSGETLKVSPGDDMVLHLSQANIGELKKQKGNESVCLFVTIDGMKLVLGTLFTDKLPQQQCNLVFEKDFELSHNWKSGSVFFYGYKSSNNEEEYPLNILFILFLNILVILNNLNAHTFVYMIFVSLTLYLFSVPLDHHLDYLYSSDSENDIPLNVANNGKYESKAKEHKSAEAAKEKRAYSGKKKVLTYAVESSSEEDYDEDDEGDDELSSFDDVSDESEEETLKKAETSKKRPVEPSSKTPVLEKKAKANPHSADGKKGCIHIDTPHPAKKAGKTLANKSNQQTPKSGGSHFCNRCIREIDAEKALKSHSKAKHDLSDSKEYIPLNVANHGKQESKAKEHKSVEAAKEKRSDSGIELMFHKLHDLTQLSNSFDEVSVESEEETPKKAEINKRRPVEPANKTHVPERKAKTNPQSNDFHTLFKKMERELVLISIKLTLRRKLVRLFLQTSRTSSNLTPPNRCNRYGI